MPHHESHPAWIQKALLEAKKALPADVPVGALILDENGQVIATGFNQREANNDPTAHAEIIALAKAGKQQQNWRLNTCTLYVTLEPCPMCAAAINQARIKTIVFGAYDPLIGACGSKQDLTQISTHTEVIGGILEEACQSLLLEFFQSKRP